MDRLALVVFFCLSLAACSSTPYTPNYSALQQATLFTSDELPTDNYAVFKGISLTTSYNSNILIDNKLLRSNGHFLLMYKENTDLLLALRYDEYTDGYRLWTLGTRGLIFFPPQSVVIHGFTHISHSEELFDGLDDRFVEYIGSKGLRHYNYDLLRSFLTEKEGIKIVDCESMMLQCKAKTELHQQYKYWLTTIEVIDYRKSVAAFNKAMQSRNFEQALSISIPSQFIDSDVLKSAILATHSIEDVEQLSLLLKHSRKSSLTALLENRRLDITFNNDFNFALNGNLKTKKEFAEKYQYLAGQNNDCVVVNASTLNIRRSSYASATKVGHYIQGDIVCIKEKKNGWLKTDKGWISAKFVKKGSFDSYKNQLAKIAEQIDIGDYNLAKQSNSVDSYKAYLAAHTSGQFNQQAINGLINAYRKLNRFDAYMSAYALSASKQDIQSALKVSSNIQQRKQIELALFNSLGANRFINIDVTASRESELKEVTSSGLVTSFKGMAKDYYRKLTISVDKNAGVPFKYGIYQAKTEVKLYLDYTLPINGKGKDFETQTILVTLSPENNYTSEHEITFSGIPVDGKFHTLAATMAAGLANLFGMNTKSSDMEIPMSLKSTKLAYELQYVNGE